ncbi:MAG: hypothetical protein KGL39_54840 [Patescibacteria group bacterium]|nr:hypothetical protein [Patescibacteria group bacterium]
MSAQIRSARLNHALVRTRPPIDGSRASAQTSAEIPEIQAAAAYFHMRPETLRSWSKERPSLFGDYLSLYRSRPLEPFEPETLALTGDALDEAMRDCGPPNPCGLDKHLRRAKLLLMPFARCEEIAAGTPGSYINSADPDEITGEIAPGYCDDWDAPIGWRDAILCAAFARSIVAADALRCGWRRVRAWLTGIDAETAIAVLAGIALMLICAFGGLDHIDKVSTIRGWGR